MKINLKQFIVLFNNIVYITVHMAVQQETNNNNKKFNEGQYECSQCT